MDIDKWKDRLIHGQPSHGETTKIALDAINQLKECRELKLQWVSFAEGLRNGLMHMFIPLETQGWKPQRIVQEYRERIEQRTKEACKTAKPDSSPWPEDIWTMTDKEYVKAIPDENMRSAISGFLMRKGWEMAVEDFEQAIDSVGRE